MKQDILWAQAMQSSVGTFVPELWQVVQKRRETPYTYTLTLTPPENTRFHFVPGQFNMLYLFGVGEVPISISSDPAQPDRLGHTIRAVGSVTRPLVALKPGAMVGVRGPFGRGWPIEEAKGKDVVIVGGGIGLAPLRPVIYHILRHRDDYGHLTLLYGARTPNELLYRRELKRWGGRFDMHVLVTVDRGVAGWHGNVGVVTTLFRQAERFFDPDNTIGLICGPEIMMRFTVREFQDRGVSNERIYLSMERNMKCGQGMCGHCQFGPLFVCKDGPVYTYEEIEPYFEVKEL